ncbi:MAG: hypothetical protein WC911_03555 [Thermoleophilia bacterium]
MLQVTFSPGGEAGYDRVFSRWAHDIDDMRPLWEALAMDFFNVIETQQFSSEGRFGSSGWDSLTTGYAKWKRKHYPGRNILERKGDLRRSLTQIGAKGNIFRVSKQQMEVGSSIPYGIYHQKGTKKMVARKPIELPESARRGWDRQISQFIMTGKIRIGRMS